MEFCQIWIGNLLTSDVPITDNAIKSLYYDCVELNIFLFWDGCKLNHFLIYLFDEKYQCLLISYKWTLFQQKQEQQQPVIDFENGVIVKIYKS